MLFFLGQYTKRARGGGGVEPLPFEPPAAIFELLALEAKWETNWKEAEQPGNSPGSPLRPANSRGLICILKENLLDFLRRISLTCCFRASPLVALFSLAFCLVLFPGLKGHHQGSATILGYPAWQNIMQQNQKTWLLACPRVGPDFSRSFCYGKAVFLMTRLAESSWFSYISHEGWFYASPFWAGAKFLRVSIGSPV